MAACTLTKNMLVESVVEEALAAFYAVEFSKKMGFYDMIFEGNALQVVNAVKAESKNLSKFGHIVDGIKIGLRQLRSWKIIHVKRDMNSAAHIPAREAIMSIIDKVGLKKFQIASMVL